MNIKDFTQEYIDRLKDALDSIDLDDVEQATDVLREAWKRDKRIFILGNGGSASTASHMACDIGKGTLSQDYKDSVRRYRTIGLTDNVATLTAFANDQGYEHVFEQQLKNLVSEGDVVIAISGSGESTNVINAVEFANRHNAVTIGMVGFDGGSLKDKVDVSIHTRSDNYGRIEDSHLILNHIFVEFLSEEREREKEDRFA